jgi:homoserine acetyltransferase
VSFIHLTLAQVYAALAYYHANRDEIEADLAEEDAEYWRLAALHSKKGVRTHRMSKILLYLNEEAMDKDRNYVR